LLALEVLGAKFDAILQKVNRSVDS